MPIYFDPTKQRWRFKFSRVIANRQYRASRVLPKGWSKADAQAYEQRETARLYTLATAGDKARCLIEDAVRLYCQHRCPQLKNGRGAIQDLAKLHGYYKGRYMDELAEVAREYASSATRLLATPDGKTGMIAPATIKNRLSYLRSACHYAQRHHGMMPNTLLTVAMPVVRNERAIFIQRRQMLAIARQCEDRRARAIVRVAFYSGMRMGEIMTIDSMVDHLFRLNDTKNGSSRSVPAHPKVWVCEKYFPVPYTQRWYQRLIRSAMDAVGFTELHLHDLRHSTASAMINANVDLYTIGKILGHKDRRSTERYSHLATQALAKAIAKIR